MGGIVPGRVDDLQRALVAHGYQVAVVYQLGGDHRRRRPIRSRLVGAQRIGLGTRGSVLLGQGRRLFGTAGTDAHQNSLPIEFRDGERGDSYRRMMSWFSNVALVSDPADPVAVKDAIARGQFR